MSDIRATIDYEGVEQGAQQIDALVERLGDLLTAEERAAIATQRFESAVQGSGEAAGRSRTALQGAAQGHVEMGRASNAAGRKMAEGINIVSEMTLGLGALNPRLREVGIAFAGAGNNAVQFAGMGLGPAGIAVGTLVGVLPALIAFLQDTGTEAERAAESLSDMERAAKDAAEEIAHLRQAREEQGRERRIQQGFGTVEEINDALQEETANVDRLRDLIRNQDEELRARRYELAGRNVLRGEFGREAQSIERAERRLEQMRREMRQSEEEARRLESQASEFLMADLAEDAQGASGFDDGSRRRRRRGNAESEARRRARAEMEANREVANEMLGFLDEEAEREAMLEEDREAARQRELDVQNQIIELKRFEGELDERLASRKEEQAERRIAQIEKEKAAARAADEERIRRVEEIGGEIADIGGKLVGVFNEAFQAAISGEQSFEDAFASGMKQILGQIGDRFVAEGIGAVLHGLTMTVTNPPAAATKIAGGTAMVAFGVGLGAAGAAIPSTSGAGAPPESPREEPVEDTGDQGLQSLTIVYNNPIHTAQTQNQLARGLRRSLGTREFAAGGG